MTAHTPPGRRKRNRAARTGSAIAAVAALAAGVLAVGGPASASTDKTCSGTAQSPGVLTGNITGNVLISGFCGINAGNATVHGSITVAPGGGLIAAFGHNDTTHSGTSTLTVTGNVSLSKGAAAELGCFATSSPCNDDPNQKSPTLNSPVKIGGNLVSTDPLGVLVHDGKIGGKVVETGGGGGVNCKPQGVFKKFMSPVFSDYEDTSVHGSLTIKGLRSCWLGVLRVHIGSNMTLRANKLADPDAIEVGNNVIGGNLACVGNTMVWDTSDTGSSLYPRVFKLNKVHGKRSGQCVRSTRTTKNGPVGTHPF